MPFGRGPKDRFQETGEQVGPRAQKRRQAQVSGCDRKKGQDHQRDGLLRQQPAEDFGQTRRPGVFLVLGAFIDLALPIAALLPASRRKPAPTKTTGSAKPAPKRKSSAKKTIRKKTEEGEKKENE